MKSSSVVTGLLWPEVELGLVLCTEASLAAGERPSGEEEEGEGVEGPVRRWTKDMNSFSVVWMTLGDTE